MFVMKEKKLGWLAHLFLAFILQSSLLTETTARGFGVNSRSGLKGDPASNKILGLVKPEEVLYAKDESGHTYFFKDQTALVPIRVPSYPKLLFIPAKSSRMYYMKENSTEVYWHNQTTIKWTSIPQDMPPTGADVSESTAAFPLLAFVPVELLMYDALQYFEDWAKNIQRFPMEYELRNYGMVQHFFDDHGMSGVVCAIQFGGCIGLDMENPQQMFFKSHLEPTTLMRVVAFAKLIAQYYEFHDTVLKSLDYAKKGLQGHCEVFSNSIFWTPIEPGIPPDDYCMRVTTKFVRLVASRTWTSRMLHSTFHVFKSSPARLPFTPQEEFPRSGVSGISGQGTDPVTEVGPAGEIAAEEARAQLENIIQTGDLGRLNNKASERLLTFEFGLDIPKDSWKIFPNKTFPTKGSGYVGNYGKLLATREDEHNRKTQDKFVADAEVKIQGWIHRSGDLSSGQTSDLTYWWLNVKEYMEYNWSKIVPHLEHLASGSFLSGLPATVSRGYTHPPEQDLDALRARLRRPFSILGITNEPTPLDRITFLVQIHVDARSDNRDITQGEVVKEVGETIAKALRIYTQSSKRVVSGNVRRAEASPGLWHIDVTIPDFEAFTNSINSTVCGDNSYMKGAEDGTGICQNVIDSASHALSYALRIRVDEVDNVSHLKAGVKDMPLVMRLRETIDFLPQERVADSAPEVVREQLNQILGSQSLAELYGEVWRALHCFVFCNADGDACEPRCYDGGRTRTEPLIADPAVAMKKMSFLSRDLLNSGAEFNNRHFGISPFADFDKLDSARSTVPILPVCRLPTVRNISTAIPCICGDDWGSESIDFWKSMGMINTKHTQKLVRSCMKNFDLEHQNPSILIANMCQLYYKVSWPSSDPERTHGVESGHTYHGPSNAIADKKFGTFCELAMDEMDKVKMDPRYTEPVLPYMDEAACRHWGEYKDLIGDTVFRDEPSAIDVEHWNIHHVFWHLRKNGKCDVQPTQDTLLNGGKRNFQP